jgi:hypothetical protein
MKKLILILCLLASRYAPAQTATGSWFGQADVEISGIHNNYLTELIIKQKGDEVEGTFGYYFKDTYQSFYVHGTYNEKTKEIKIPAIPVIFYNTNSTVNSIECNTNFVGTMFFSKVKTQLTGHFYHDGKYKYLCPDLKATYTLNTEQEPDSTAETITAAKKYWKPQPDDYLVSGNETKKEVLAPKPDSVKSSAVFVQPAADDHAKDDAVKIKESFEKRKSILSKEILVESDSLRLSFYDNGDIDGDSISVFLNKQLVLTHQGLTARAINMFMILDSTKDVNIVDMFAENLGTIPPNTALMIINDGKNRFEVYMSSSLTQNAMVRIRKKKK